MDIDVNAIAGFQRMHLDSKRRGTFSNQMLEGAGMPDVTELVWRVEGPGRIVIEDPDILFASVQDQFASVLADQGTDPDAVIDSLLADRAADTSLV